MKCEGSVDNCKGEGLPWNIMRRAVVQRYKTQMTARNIQKEHSLAKYILIQEVKSLSDTSGYAE